MNSEELKALLTKIFDEVRPELIKQSTAWNPLLAKIASRSEPSITRGDPIVETFGYEGHDGPTAAQYQLAQYSVPLALSGSEHLSKAQITNRLVEKFDALAATYSNLFGSHVYGDGTGNNGRNITGLAAAVAVSPTNVYGGIDRTLPENAFWKNQSFTASEQLAAPATAQTIQQAWNTTVVSLTCGEEKPDLILAAPDVFKIFDDSLTEKPNKSKSKLERKGFRALQFQGIDVVWDSQVPYGHAYFLNTKHFNFRTHEKRNFALIDPTADESGFVAAIAWAGNLTCTNPQLQGVWRNV